MTEQAFYLECGQEYLDLIKTAQGLNRGLLREPGYNIHHIHPVSLLGSRTDPKNLVKLTLLEHCIAHALLFKSIPRQATARALITVAMGNQYKGLTESERDFLNEQYKWDELVLEAHRFPVTYETLQRLSAARKGRVCVTNGVYEKMIPADQLGFYIDQGYWRGHTKNHCEKTSKNSRGRIYVHNSVEERLIWPEEFEFFIKKGYIKGRRPEHDQLLQKNRQGKTGRVKGWQHTEETKQKMSQSHLGNIPGNKGRIVVNDKKHNKYILAEQQQEYLDHGWMIGPLPCTEERCKRISENSKGHKWTEESKNKKREQMKGTVRLYREGESKTIRVPMEEKQRYLDQGWTTARVGTNRSEAHKRASQTRNQQRKFSKDGVRRWFNPGQFQDAISDGWAPVRPLNFEG